MLLRFLLLLLCPIVAVTAYRRDPLVRTPIGLTDPFPAQRHSGDLLLLSLSEQTLLSPRSQIDYRRENLGGRRTMPSSPISETQQVYKFCWKHHNVYQQKGQKGFKIASLLHLKSETICDRFAFLSARFFLFILCISVGVFFQNHGASMMVRRCSSREFHLTHKTNTFARRMCICKL